MNILVREEKVLHTGSGTLGNMNKDAAVFMIDQSKSWFKQVWPLKNNLNCASMIIFRSCLWSAPIGILVLN